MKIWQRIGLITCILILAITGHSLTDSPVRAQERDSSDFQLTVSQSVQSSVYGDNVVIKAFLVHPADYSLFVNQWMLFIDNEEIDGYPNSNPYDATTQVLNYDASSLSPGTHTIKSTFQPNGSSTVITSNVLIHTVQKETPNLLCTITNENSLNFSPGHQLNLHVGFTSVNGINEDYLDGTYTITFADGLNSITEANLTAEPGLIVPVTAPTTPGTYELLCNYNGSSLLNPAQKDYGSITVSAQHPISGIQVASSLAHFAPNQAITINIMLLGSSGLPSPTGIIALSIGSYHTSAIELDGAGDATIQTTLPSNISSTDPLGIYYYGDSNYSVTSANFPPPFSPLPSQPSSPQPVTISTTTAAPGAAGTTPTKTTVAPATSTTAETTPTSDATATAIPGALAVATNSLPPTSTSNHAPHSGDATPWLILVLSLLVLGGGGGAYLYLHRRNASHPMPVTSAAPDDSEHGFTFSEERLI